MPDAAEPGPGAEEGTDGGAKGIMVPVVLLLFGILIVMVVFMNLSGQNATAATAITETTWQLRSMTDYHGNTTPVLNGTVVTAAFGLDGRLTGNGGCNGYSGRFLVKETAIVISRITRTSMACWDAGSNEMDSNVNRQEELYFGMLEEAASLRVHDRVLTLYDNDGKLILTFDPAVSA